MHQPLKFDRTITTGAVISFLGFFLTFCGGIFLAGSFYSIQEQRDVTFNAAQKRQEEYNKNLEMDRKTVRVAYDAKIDVILQSLTKTASIIDQQTYQIAQLQQKNTETDARLGRITESYGDKFTEIQSTLANMNTQIALISQTVTELKQIAASYKETRQ
jgi:chromosome segregation ATPase